MPNALGRFGDKAHRSTDSGSELLIQQCDHASAGRDNTNRAQNFDPAPRSFALHFAGRRVDHDLIRFSVVSVGK